MRRLRLLGAAVAAVGLASGCATGFPGTPTYVTDVSATINGLVASSEGGTTSYWAEYGETSAYGHQSATRSYNATARNPFPISIPIAGLTASTTYHYRICAQDSQPGVGGGCSADATFETDGPGSRSGIAFLSFRGPGSPFTTGDVFAMAADGGGLTNLTNSASSSDGSPAWSPDARQIAYERLAYDGDNHAVGTSQIYAMNASGSNKHPLTSDSAYHYDPAWSPDGKRIAYSRRLFGYDVWVMDADGTDQAPLVYGAEEAEPAWSPDGSRIAYIRWTHGGVPDIWVVNADGTSKHSLTSTPSLAEFSPAWSPDGTRIAFTRNLGGSLLSDVFVMAADGSDPVNVTNLAGHQGSPTWSPDGSTIAFVQESQDIFSISALGGTPVNLTKDAIEDFNPAWSPRP